VCVYVDIESTCECKRLLSSHVLLFYLSLLRTWEDSNLLHSHVLSMSTYTHTHSLSFSISLYCLAVDRVTLLRKSLQRDPQIARSRKTTCCKLKERKKERNLFCFPRVHPQTQSSREDLATCDMTHSYETRHTQQTWHTRHMWHDSFIWDMTHTAAHSVVRGERLLRVLYKIIIELTFSEREADPPWHPCWCKISQKSACYSIVWGL